MANKVRGKIVKPKAAAVPQPQPKAAKKYTSPQQTEGQPFSGKDRTRQIKTRKQMIDDMWKEIP